MSYTIKSPTNIYLMHEMSNPWHESVLENID